MAISFVGFDGAEVVTSIALPSFAEGDVALCLAHRDQSGAVPSLPAGWTSIRTATTAASASHLGYRVLQAGDTTSGTWTNATEVNVHILRGQGVPAIGDSAVGTGNTAIVTIPALTLDVADGSSWVVSLVGHRQTIIDTFTPTGLTNRGSGAGNRFANAADTNAGVATFTGTTFNCGSDGTSGRQWHAYAIEIRFLTDAPGPDVGTMFGGIATYSLANTIVDGTATHVSEAFIAEREANVVSIRQYLAGGSGYSLGTGGTYTVSICPDTGAGEPNLAAPMVQTTSVAPGSSSNAPGFQVVFTGGTPLITGELYHLVWNNTDGSPNANFMSINAIWDPNATPFFYRWPNVLHHRLQKRVGGTWQVRSAYVGIMEVIYDDGHVQGMPYIEMSYEDIPGEVADINAATTRMVRQVFTMTGDRHTSGAGICLTKNPGSTGLLTVAIRSSGAGRGTLINSFTVPAADFPDGVMSGSLANAGEDHDWGGGTFSQPILLLDGVTYRVEYSTTGNSRFLGWPIRRGDVFYGYSGLSTTLWPSGISQYSTDDGANWANHTDDDNDLPAYLEFLMTSPPVDPDYSLFPKRKLRPVGSPA